MALVPRLPFFSWTAWRSPMRCLHSASPNDRLHRAPLVSVRGLHRLCPSHRVDGGVIQIALVHRIVHTALTEWSYAVSQPTALRACPVQVYLIHAQADVACMQATHAPVRGQASVFCLWPHLSSMMVQRQSATQGARAMQPASHVHQARVGAVRQKMCRSMQKQRLKARFQPIRALGVAWQDTIRPLEWDVADHYVSGSNVQAM